MLVETQNGRTKVTKGDEEKDREIFIHPPANYCVHEVSPADLVTSVKLHC